MKFLKVLVMSVVCTASLIGAQRLMAADAMPNGLLRLAGHDNGEYFPCSLDVKTGHYPFNIEGALCINDRMNYFQLDSAPSATSITLYKHSIKSRGICNEGSGVTEKGWQYTFKTIKHPTTTRWININELHLARVGDIVVPGVMLTAKHEKGTGDDRKDELSCVKIVRSALP
jgi:hypothetical protein